MASDSDSLSVASTTSLPEFSLSDLTRVVSESEINAAEVEKAAGNALFLSHNFHAALKHYELAIDLNPNVAAYYGNAAACRIKLEEYGAAIMEATKAITIDKGYVKV